MGRCEKDLSPSKSLGLEFHVKMQRCYETKNSKYNRRIWDQEHWKVYEVELKGKKNGHAMI